MYADSKTSERFRKVFGVRMEEYCDVMLTVAKKEFNLDMFKFDDYLHKKFGEYEMKGLSMSTLIEKEYGTEAVKLMKTII